MYRRIRTSEAGPSVSVGVARGCVARRTGWCELGRLGVARLPSGVKSDGWSAWTL